MPLSLESRTLVYFLFEYLNNRKLDLDPFPRLFLENYQKSSFFRYFTTSRQRSFAQFYIARRCIKIYMTIFDIINIFIQYPARTSIPYIRSDIDFNVRSIPTERCFIIIYDVCDLFRHSYGLLTGKTSSRTCWTRCDAPSPARRSCGPRSQSPCRTPTCRSRHSNGGSR